jgi:hypothetical protein
MCFQSARQRKQYGSTEVSLMALSSIFVRIDWEDSDGAPAVSRSQGASLAISATLDVRGLALPERPRELSRAPSLWLLVFLHRALVKRFPRT